MLNKGSFFATLLLAFAFDEGTSVTIQALIDLDDDSEDLVKSLISKVDTIIDPKVIDTKNATQELAHALLKLGPLLNVIGNITDHNHGLSISFSFSAKAGVNALTHNDTKQSVQVRDMDDPNEIMKMKGGILQPLVEFLEPYFIGIVTILANGIMSNIIAHFMNELALLSSTNLS